MKKYFFIIIVSIVILFLAFYLLFKPRDILINNTVPPQEIITEDHGLEKLLLTEAIFEVRSGFDNVQVNDLAKEVGLKLECKRQSGAQEFYYLVFGDGYRCFIFTDIEGIVQNVIVVREFATIAQTKAHIDTLESNTSILDSAEYGFRDLWRNCGNSSVFRTFLFTLEDGVMLIKAVDPYKNPTYFFFTDEEWCLVCGEWNGFTILPIDKHPS